MEGVLLHRLIRPENQRNLLHVRRLYVALAHPDDVDTNELDEFVRGAVGPREVFLRYDTQGLNSLQGSNVTTLYLANIFVDKSTSVSLPHLTHLSLVASGFARDTIFDFPRLKHLYIAAHRGEASHLDQLAPNLVSCDYDAYNARSLPLSLTQSRTFPSCQRVWRAFHLTQSWTTYARVLTLLVEEEEESDLLERCVEFVDGAEHSLVAVILPLEEAGDPALSARLADACSRRQVQLVREDRMVTDDTFDNFSPWFLRMSEQRWAEGAS